MRGVPGRGPLDMAKISFLLALLAVAVIAQPRYRDSTLYSSDSSSSEESSESTERSSEHSTSSSQDTSQDITTERQDTGSMDDVRRIVQQAFENGELLGREEWAAGARRRVNKNVQRDTSRHQAPATTTPTTTRTQTHGGRTSKEVMMSDDGIVFPKDNEPSTPTYKPLLDQVPMCEGSTYCNTVPYYPEDFITKALKQNASLRLLAGVDVISNVTDVVGRIDTTNDVPLCLSNEQLIFPKSAESEHKKWHLIVNQEEFQQGVRIETCLNEGTACKLIDGLIEGYTTSCKQKFIYRELAAIMDDGNLSPRKFKFPSSCCCHVKFTGNTQTRMGLSTDEQQTSAPARSRRRK